MTILIWFLLFFFIIDRNALDLSAFRVQTNSGGGATGAYLSAEHCV